MHEMTYKTLPRIFFSEVNRGPLIKPEMVVFNDDLSESIQHPFASREWLELLKTNRPIKGQVGIAQAYAGHQFGHLTMLGDGRALLVEEHVSPDGAIWDIHLKGSGKTPYSRGGDGKAVLGPMLREYLISESLHALGIPTTRSLAVLKTGERVIREKQEIGGLLIRIASSHLRVGTFEFAASKGEVKALADYAIKRHYTHLNQLPNPYEAFLRSVIEKQAALIAKWQLVGFVHGVMNTDNMSISGEAIDFGPCAFLDTYAPKTVFSSIDHYGRYRYENQPAIGLWNLSKLASSLLPLLANDTDQAIHIAQEALDTFWPIFQREWLNGMGNKLGIQNFKQEDAPLILDWLKLLEKHQMDYTNAHLFLTQGRLEALGFTTEGEWYKRWQLRLSLNPEGHKAAKDLMVSVNPTLIPRNHLVEEALKSEVAFDALLSVLKRPYHFDAKDDSYRVPGEKGYRTFCGT